MTRRVTGKATLPIGFCMLCAELGTLRQAVWDARLYGRHQRAYVCEFHYRSHCAPGTRLEQ